MWGSTIIIVTLTMMVKMFLVLMLLFVRTKQRTVRIIMKIVMMMGWKINPIRTILTKNLSLKPTLRGQFCIW